MQAPLKKPRGSRPRREPAGASAEQVPQKGLFAFTPLTASKGAGIDTWVPPLAGHRRDDNGYEQHLEARGGAPGKEEGERGMGDTLRLGEGARCTG